MGRMWRLLVRIVNAFKRPTDPVFFCSLKVIEFISNARNKANSKNLFE